MTDEGGTIRAGGDGDGTFRLGLRRLALQGPGTSRCPPDVVSLAASEEVSSATAEPPAGSLPQLSVLAFSHSEMANYSLPSGLATMPEP